MISETFPAGDRAGPAYETGKADPRIARSGFSARSPVERNSMLSFRPR